MLQPAIEIRAARRDELALVQRLAHVIWHAHYPGIISAEQIDYMLARGYAVEALTEFVAASDRGLELALADGEPAGFAAWYRVGNANEAKLDKLYVLQSRQRHGLGGQLIGRVAGQARATGATTLILNVNRNNAQAIRAYARHGFAIREAVVVDIGNGFVMDDFVMARNL
jgi:GNAT superfamily N-acetyltransferase